MAFFKRKKSEILDLTENYSKPKENPNSEAQSQTPTTSDSNGLGFFGAMAQTASQNSDENSGYADLTTTPDERKRKLSKRLLEMTNKIEDLSNQIYHLQQRIELLERKAGLGY